MSKKKIFIFSENFAYPLTHGGAIAQFFFLERLCEDFEITYSTIICNKKQKEQISQLQQILPNLRFACFEDINRIGWKYKLAIYLVGLKNKLKDLAKRMLIQNNSYGVDSCLTETQINYYSCAVISFLERKFRDEKYDFIQLEFFESLSLLNILPPNAKKIFIHHEIRFKRLFMQEKRRSLYIKYRQNIIKNFELSCLKLADKIIVFNDDDKFLLKELTNEIVVSPFGIPSKLICKHEVSSTFDKFIFLGGSGHYPNREGLEWFLDLIYLPYYNETQKPIYIIGNWDHQFISKYKNYTQIHFTGVVPEVRSYFDNSILICPILSGSGIRTKILEAFANKVPVLSTRLGGEGLYEINSIPDHLMLFDDIDEYKSIIDKIIKNPDLLLKLAIEGYNYYNQSFNTEKLINIRKAIYN